MNLIKRGFISMLASIVLAAASPAMASPLAGLHDLAGRWKCTYRGGAVSLAYDATYAYQRDGHELREIAAWTGGGDEEILTYDSQRRGWTAVVLDDQGTTTVMHATGSDPNHFVLRSVYPDSSIAVKFDAISSTKYLLHGTVHLGGKTITSVDTCLRDAR